MVHQIQFTRAVESKNELQPKDLFIGSARNDFARSDETDSMQFCLVAT